MSDARGFAPNSRDDEASRDVVAGIWQKTFDAIRDGVAVVDAGGRLLQANEALQCLTGRERAALTGATFEDVVYDALEIERLALVPAVLRRKDRESAEVVSGGRWLRVTGDPMLDASGTVQCIVVTIADVTELKQLEDAERERAEADHRQDEFLAMLAHELRNPLNAIATAVGLQERMGAQDPQNVRLRAIVMRQTRHLARLVDDLLDVSRITRGQIQLHREPGDLRTTLRQAIQGMLPQVEAKHQFLTVQLPPEPVCVNGDMLRLEQVMVNILGNASKYSATEGHISVACEATPAGVEIRVKDDGMGIPAGKLDSIFDLFVQLDPPLARSVGGLGIGLTVARRLVSLHDGTLEARSPGVGRGAEFVIRLPTVAMDEPSMLQIDGPEAAPAGGARLDVLLVEDNADTRELMRGLLESWGHHVTVAADGASGLATALDSRPDVALIDVGLPGIDGYQVAQTLRASAPGKDMLLVALTGYGRPEDRARAIQSGFDKHLVKPVQPDELRGILADRSAASKRQQA
ncbi:MAG: ATP-binding protein [Vicinamibacterales bacterium]